MSVGADVRLVDWLIARGLSAVEASAKARLFAETDAALPAAAADAGAGAGADDDAADRLRWYVPGRIEVLGKHTDYAGGRSLVCAVERGFCVSARPRADARLRIVDVTCGTGTELLVSATQPEMARWRNYPATVARRLARNFPGALRGADVAIASDLPRAAGLSSSSALIVAVFSVLAEVNRLDARAEYVASLPDTDALASYLGCIENGRSFRALAGDRGVGTQGGSQDHLAIIGSEAGHVTACRFSPVQRDRFVPVPAGSTFVIGASGVTATKTGDARARYNRAAEAVAEALRRWRMATGRNDATLFDALASAPDARVRLRAAIERGDEANASAHTADVPRAQAGERFTAAELIARVEQFDLEACSLVPAATDALAAADLATFGDLVDRSLQAAARGLNNQIPETLALAALARAAGARAASAFGAGFGGSVWALVPSADASAFLAAWRDAYLARFPRHADKAVFFVSGAGPARLRLP